MSLGKEKKAKENRRVRKMKKQIKELRQLVARARNDIYRRKHQKKARREEKRIMEQLKRKVNNNLNKSEDLMTAKKIWLDKLREKIVKMERHNIIASSKKMKETSTRKKERYQHTKDNYQQWINSRNSGQAYGKIRMKHPIKNGWKKSRKYERQNQTSGRITYH